MKRLDEPTDGLARPARDHAVETTRLEHDCDVDEKIEKSALPPTGQYSLFEKQFLDLLTLREIGSDFEHFPIVLNELAATILAAVMGYCEVGRGHGKRSN